ncbi:MAG: hypothetical protein H0T57_14300 [Rubrobacter sp.]|nr:hypothetical protein [Rubrobacter sp.]
MLAKLAELHLPEIIEAASENQDAAWACGIYVIIKNGQENVVGEDLSVIYRGMRPTAEAGARGEQPSHEQVKAGVCHDLEETVNKEVASLQDLRPRSVLTKLLSFPPLRADSLAGYLSCQQQRELRLLLYRELGNKPVALRIDQAPKLSANSTLDQRRYQLLWRLWRLRVTEPDSRRALGGVPRFLVVGDADAIITNKKTGMLSDPLGPIQAKVWPRLGRELNKHGYPIGEPESQNRSAKSIGVSRSTVQRYLEAGPSPRLTPDGKGGLHTEYTIDDVVEALEKSSQRKRNKRKPEGS